MSKSCIQPVYTGSSTQTPSPLYTVVGVNQIKITVDAPPEIDLSKIKITTEVTSLLTDGESKSQASVVGDGAGIITTQTALISDRGTNTIALASADANTTGISTVATEATGNVNSPIGADVAAPFISGTAGATANVDAPVGALSVSPSVDAAPVDSGVVGAPVGMAAVPAPVAVVPVNAAPVGAEIVAAPVDAAVVEPAPAPLETTNVPTIAPGEPIPTGTTALEPKPEIIAQPIASITGSEPMTNSAIEPVVTAPVTESVNTAVVEPTPAPVAAPVAVSNDIQGTDNRDRLIGDVESNVISGFGGNDCLSGRGGDDLLLGGGGDDRLFGGKGNDTLDGYGGTKEYDRLVGGYGADTFVLGSQEGAYYQDKGYAVLTDFCGCEGDVIKLAGSFDDYVFTHGTGSGSWTNPSGGKGEFLCTNDCDLVIRLKSNNDAIAVVKNTDSIDPDSICFV